MGLFGKKGAKKLSFAIEGMTCEHCQQSIEEGLRSLGGIESAKVSLKKKRALMVYDPRSITPEEVSRKVEELGYRTDIA